MLYLWLANGANGSILVAVLVFLTATVAVLVATRGRLSLPASGDQAQLDVPLDRAVVAP